MINAIKQKSLFFFKFVCKIVNLFRFFSRAKSHFTHSKLKEEEEDIERIGAIPSIEDKTRTFPHWTMYIAWACKTNKQNLFFEIIFFFHFLVVILSICTCSFFIILYSLEWGAKRANEWLITMILSFGQSILVIDPLKVFLITAIISFLIRRPYDDETLDFNDPFTGTLISNNIMPDMNDQDIYNDTNVKGRFELF
jgi:hypothetical protein